MSKIEKSYLPELFGVTDGMRQGRNVHDGYQRGWGLQHAGLHQKVLADPLYREACALANGRTVVAELNRINLFLILKFFLPGIEQGHIVEFGSYKGGNAIFMAYVAAKTAPGTKVYALDSFEGMPSTNQNLDLHAKGDFSDVDLKELQSFSEKNHLENLEFCRGYFEDTAPQILQKAGKIALTHIDCDIASSVQYSYEAVKPFMVKGGYIVFDDATVSSCIGATEVVENIVIRRDGLNSEQIFPHYVFRS